MMKKIEAFKYMYKEQFKELEKLMKERDKQLEDNDVYQSKIWPESLDLINQNLSKLLECISELEGSINQVGEKARHVDQCSTVDKRYICKRKGNTPCL